VVHAGGHQQPAGAGAVQQHRAVLLDVLRHRGQRAVQRGGHARVLGLLRLLLVGHQAGLHRDPHLVVDRLDLVVDRGDRALGEGHQPGAADPHPAPGR
jgi:hypothetical protein